MFCPCLRPARCPPRRTRRPTTGTKRWPSCCSTSKRAGNVGRTGFRIESCRPGDREPSASPQTSASPGTSAVPGAGHDARSPGRPAGRRQLDFQLHATPRPQPGSSAAVTPPPVPTPTPSPVASSEPIFLIRGGETPPPISPAGQSTPQPTPAPTGGADAAARTTSRSSPIASPGERPRPARRRRLGTSTFITATKKSSATRPTSTASARLRSPAIRFSSIISTIRCSRAT